MKVTPGMIVSRGLSNRCPNCGGRRLFKEGTLFELNGECPDCHLKFEKDEGASSLAYRKQMNRDGSPSETVSATYRWSPGTELARAANHNLKAA